MTAYAGDFMKVWTQSSQASEYLIKKVLLAMLDSNREEESKLVRRMKKGKPMGTQTVRWMEERQYPSSIHGALSTSTFTVPDAEVIFGAAVTAESFKHAIRQNTILERVSDRMQMRVTTAQASLPTATAWAVTVTAHGASTLSDDAGDVEYRIIGEPWSDYRVYDHARQLGRFTRTVGTMIDAEGFEIPKTRENTDYEMISNEADHQIKALVEKLARKQDRALLGMQPQYSGGVPITGSSTETPTVTGLCAWLPILQAEQANTDVYVNAAGAPLSKPVLDRLAHYMYASEQANFDKGDWVLACSPIVKQSINQWDESYRRRAEDSKKVGNVNDTVVTEQGEFPVISDRQMPPGVAALVNFDNCSWGYYKGYEAVREPISTNAFYKAWLIGHQYYGVVLRYPRQSIGMIYGLPTTLS